MGCKVCEVLKAENEHLRKWIDRIMDERHPDPEGDEQAEQATIPDLSDPDDNLSETVTLGEG